MSHALAIVTRPAPEAQRWVRLLASYGVAAWALPLLTIAPLGERAALDAARARLGCYDAAMFVSAAAVRHFFEQKPGMAGEKCAFDAIKTRAWATGPGTRRALLEAGWPAARIDAPDAHAPTHDSEALWARVAPSLHAVSRVLIVRGGDAGGQPQGREWLAERLLAAGAAVDVVVAYRRLPALFGTEERAALAWALDHRAVWLLSSTQALAVLRAVAADAPWSQARAVATHPRIAEAARRLGFGTVITSAADAAAIAASIESLR